jgi:hypothetical protein
MVIYPLVFIFAILCFNSLYFFCSYLKIRTEKVQVFLSSAPLFRFSAKRRRRSRADKPENATNCKTVWKLCRPYFFFGETLVFFDFARVLCYYKNEEEKLWKAR